MSCAEAGSNDYVGSSTNTPLMTKDALLFTCLLVLGVAAQNTAHPIRTYLVGLAVIYLLRKACERWGRR